MTLPIDLEVLRNSCESSPVTAFAETFQARFDLLHDAVKANIAECQKKSFEQHQKRAKEHNFAVGDRVYKFVDFHPATVDMSHKYQKQYTGPYEIMHFYGPNAVKLRDIYTDTELKTLTNVNKLRLVRDCRNRVLRKYLHKDQIREEATDQAMNNNDKTENCKSTAEQTGSTDRVATNKDLETTTQLPNEVRDEIYSEQVVNNAKDIEEVSGRDMAPAPTHPSSESYGDQLVGDNRSDAEHSHEQQPLLTDNEQVSRTTSNAGASYNQAQNYPVVKITHQKRSNKQMLFRCRLDDGTFLWLAAGKIPQPIFTDYVSRVLKQQQQRQKRAVRARRRTIYS